jgi:hypothetical protein
MFSRPMSAEEFTADLAGKREPVDA